MFVTCLCIDCRPYFVSMSVSPCSFRLFTVLYHRALFTAHVGVRSRLFSTKSVFLNSLAQMFCVDFGLVWFGLRFCLFIWFFFLLSIKPTFSISHCKQRAPRAQLCLTYLHSSTCQWGRVEMTNAELMQS